MKIDSPAKINIFLKITGVRDNYHTILSRFVKIDSLKDTLYFKPSDKFDIIGDFDCDIKQNSIYKAYILLKDIDPKVEKFFKNYKVIVEKNIPKFAGLGGGSSNAASFLKLSNQVLSLNLSQKRLHDIGMRIGADVAFFLSDFKSANVSGIGEIINEFKEELPKFEIFTPKISCSTPKVYQEFRKNYLPTIDTKFANRLKDLKSVDILNEFEAIKLNDLLSPALTLYPELKNFISNRWFFSGSGSSIFRKIDG